MQEGIQISSFIVLVYAKRDAAEGHGICAFGFPGLSHLREWRSIKWFGEEVLGSWIPGHRYPQDQSSKALPRLPTRGGGPEGRAGGGGSVCPLAVRRSALLGPGSTSAAAASRGLTAPPSAAPGAPRGLAAAVRPLGSAVVGPAAPVVAQAAAPTPRAAAAPGAGATAGGDWGALWGAFRGAFQGGTLGRGLALLLVLLAGHLGGRVQELRERQRTGQTSTQRPPLWTFAILSFSDLLKAWQSKSQRNYTYNRVFQMLSHYLIGNLRAFCKTDIGCLLSTMQDIEDI